MVTNNLSCQYEVLNPCGEVDPLPPRGLTPRIVSLEGKTIGLFANHKRAALPIQAMVEKKLRERFPSSKFSQYQSHHAIDTEMEIEDREEFEKWLGGVDAVVVAIGD